MDLHSLKVFCQVMDEGSFSAAARALQITQPTVSQQISRLESHLKGKLFERVGHKIIPTELAGEFKKIAREILEKMESFEDDLHQVRTIPSGLVRYAMPESCQWTPHYRKIMSQIKTFPEIQFEIGILPSHAIIQQLLEGKIDFGFIVGERLNPELRFEKFSDEPYTAVSGDPKQWEPLLQGDLKKLRLISFPGWELFFKAWIKANGINLKSKNFMPTSTVRIGTLAGAIHAAQEGAGLAILPAQCVLLETKTKKLHAFPGQKSASHSVYIGRRLGEKLPKRAEVVLDLLKQAKRELG